jgi:uridine kinase
MDRAALLAYLAARILALIRPHPVRVALDGVDAAGKTTLADDLVPLLQAAGRPVVRASVDGFHQPRARRYARGALSPEGYYYDAFDYAALRARLLAPLGSGGDGHYQTASFDFRQDVPLDPPVQQATPDMILLVDGVFLLRPELRDGWDFTIFVDIPFETSLARALIRDQELFGSAEKVRERYLQRYIPGQRLYLQAARPREYADVVVENSDPQHPRLLDIHSH